MLSKIKGAVTGAPPDQAAAATDAASHIRGMASRINCPQDTPRNRAAAKAYMSYRLSGQVQQLQQLCDPNISFRSQRDGQHVGLGPFMAYVQKTPTEGQWGEPTIDPTGLVRIDGRIKWGGVIPISVKGIFRFGPDGKITELFVGKA
eukprot:TRINITY_DN22379_c0_g1_i1.p2 TRINITY_DN22379_c0_g1~~TRINITY_DN22379_c0_g1_i1.p2  ORF type:complete len:168 (+),score=24.81 TRINITY_DN22379_c0_g1_i1:65-505(+)